MRWEACVTSPIVGGRDIRPSIRTNFTEANISTGRYITVEVDTVRSLLVGWSIVNPSGR